MLFSDGPGIETALEQKEKEPIAGTSSTNQAMDIDTPIRDDGFGGHLGQDIICMIKTIIIVSIIKHFHEKREREMVILQ